MNQIQLPDAIAPYAKAVAILVYLVAGGLALVITGGETFADVTLAEWLAVVLYVVFGTGLVYVVPNRPAA